MFEAELREEMRAAWNDASPQFEEVAVAVANLPVDSVRRHGLAGPQLRFKLATVRYWTERLQGGGANAGFVLRRLLDAIDTLLDSLLAATCAGSSLKELRDAVRDSVSD